MKLHLVADEEPNSARPKLGLGYLSAYLTTYLPGTKVSLSFANDNLLADIKRYQPDIVGFSAMTPTFTAQVAKANLVKQTFPSLPLIFGGVHLTLVPAALPTWVDLGLLGEGEHSLLQVVKLYGQSHQLIDPAIPGLIYWQKKSLKTTGPAKLIEPLDTIPFPDWDLLRVGKSGPGHIMTSRGCPYHCRFCESGKFWRKYRFHSAEYVVDQINTIYTRYHRSELVIMDDLFFLNQDRLEKILHLLVAKKLTQKMRFEVIGRVDLFTEPVAKILKQMHVFAISFGMESGSEKVLSYLKNTTITTTDIRRAVDLAQRYGLQVLGTFMLGNPHETVSDIKKTLYFIKELDLDQVGINVTTPFPGTPLWDLAKQKGLIAADTWDDNLWAMRDLTAKNFGQKKLLTDLSKEQFLPLLAQAFALQDWTHRKRRNQQLYWDYLASRSLWSLALFLLHCCRRPLIALYNFRHRKYKIT